MPQRASRANKNRQLELKEGIKPTNNRINILKNFGYLKSTTCHGIVFSSGHDARLVVRYVYSDYVVNMDDKKFTMIHVFTLIG